MLIVKLEHCPKALLEMYASHLISDKSNYRQEGIVFANKNIVN